MNCEHCDQPAEWNVSYVTYPRISENQWGTEWHHAYWCEAARQKAMHERIHVISFDRLADEYKKGDQVIYVIGLDEYEGVVDFVYEHRGMTSVYINHPGTHFRAAIVTPDMIVKRLPPPPPPKPLRYYPSRLAHTGGKL